MVGDFCSVAQDFFVVLVRAPPTLHGLFVFLDAARAAAAAQKMAIATHIVARG